MGCKETLPSALTFLCLLSTTSKFEYWFPFQSKDSYASTSEIKCSATLADYHQARDTGRSKSSEDEASTCAHQLQCLLENLPGDVRARMTSANVLLGATPALLASVSPKVAEISLLSIERPILSVLLTWGAPAVHQSRVLTYDSALRILEEKSHDPIGLGKLRNWRNLCVVSAVEYLLAIVSVVNVLCTSYLLGMRTVLAWVCVSWYFPLVWTTVPVVINWVSRTAFKRAFYSCPWSNGCWSDDVSQRAKFWEKRVEATTRTIIWHYIATLLGFLHLAFGALIYSSLLFIETTDVVYVLGRYLASTGLCRLILKFEISRMRKVYRERDRKPDQEQELYNYPPGNEEHGRRGNTNERDTATLMAR